jgi:hypothetical protein
MRPSLWPGLPVLAVLAGLLGFSHGARVEPGSPDREAAERGRQALLGKAYIPATISPADYDNAWKHWGLTQRPSAEDYPRLVRERYGLHAAPYANDGYPMGLRHGRPPGDKGLAFDCLLCHGGSIAGQSYVGLGNCTIDFQALSEELSGSPRLHLKTPFTFTQVRGTTEATASAIFLMGLREPDLTFRLPRVDLGLHDDLCEDTPAWWLLKKKKTMYRTGGVDAHSVRSLMQFMLVPGTRLKDFEKAESDFRDIHAYLMTLEPPKYPLPINRELARTGEGLFKASCARCHGTYGDNWTYPNKIIPLDEIGTDRRRLEGLTKEFRQAYEKSWFGQEIVPGTEGGYPIVEPKGYQAPPLDGIWATAPYLHNGSVPTLYGVLNSKARPAVFTRSYRTDLEVYDSREVGWKVQLLPQAPDPATTLPLEFRKVYDTSKSGRSNRGHIYGDNLTDEERWAIIEYLKTI